MAKDEVLDEVDAPEDEEVLKLLTSIDGRLEALVGLMGQLAGGIAALVAAETEAPFQALSLPSLNLDALDGLGETQ